MTEAMSIVKRWTAFNAVGAAGMAVQIGTLALLVRVCRWHYVPATALAVEAAVLHNFFWHQRWTWRDRPAGSWRSALSRLGRFHTVNGAISLAGNVTLAGLLAGALGVDPVWANVAAIAICSVANFAASERIVFRPLIPVAATVMVTLSSASIWAGTLGVRAADSMAASPATLAAWRSYASILDARQARAGPDGAFFASTTPDWMGRVRAGDVHIEKIETGAVPGGRIHHWVGAVFVPSLTVPAVIDRLERYAGQESELYEDVVASKLMARDGDRLTVYMKLRRTSIITVTYNTEHAIEYRRISGSRAMGRSVATRIAELDDGATAREREKPAAEDRGFLWGLNAYWRYEATSGGVLIECESVSLSRPVPLLIRPLANPIVDRIARESLERTLRSLRAALSRPS
jgi:putative flippase GtrA